MGEPEAKSAGEDWGVRNGWFFEKEVMWPGQAFGLRVESVLHEERSDYQHILVFQSSTYGRVLVLDGVIQLTERDEFAYQEMMVHVPMMAHSDPRHVLIVGGGDGGVLREVCRHPGVETITMCEIDQRVVEVAKIFFKDSMATAFNDPRLELKFQDAAEYIKDHPGAFDVIVCDSSDPVGPAESLYTAGFYLSVKQSLREGGVVCCQGECQWLHLDLIAEVLTHCSQLFPTVDYGYTCVPSYPSGQLGLLLCSKDGGQGALTPRRQMSPPLLSQLRYYNPGTHQAAFLLPSFAERVIGPLRKRAEIMD